MTLTPWELLLCEPGSEACVENKPITLARERSDEVTSVYHEDHKQTCHQILIVLKKAFQALLNYGKAMQLLVPSQGTGLHE